MIPVVSYDQSLDSVVVTHRETFTNDDVGQGLLKVVSLQRETGSIRVVVDLLNCEVKASIFEIYELAAREHQHEGLSPSSRIAILVPSTGSAREAGQFYETVCLNRGWDAKVFPNRESAMSWLKDAERPNKAGP